MYAKDVAQPYAGSVATASVSVSPPEPCFVDSVAMFSWSPSSLWLPQFTFPLFHGVPQVLSSKGGSKMETSKRALFFTYDLTVGLRTCSQTAEAV